MSQTLTNGNTPSSHFIDHLTSYPAVSDGINAFKSNPYGKKSLDLSNTGYEKLVSPFIPYAKGPYGYVKPYVAKADSLASDGLTKVDHRFPIMKEDTQKIKGTVMDYAFAPFRLAGDGKNYLLDLYGGEYKKCGGDGYVAGGKAFITTGLVLTSDTLAWLSEFMSQKKDEGEVYAKKRYSQASQFAHEKSTTAAKFADEKAEQAKNMAYMSKDQALDKTKDVKDVVKEKTGTK